MHKKTLGIALAAASLLVYAGSAHAEFIADIQQVGSNVVVTGSGTLDLNGLTYEGSMTSPSGVAPGLGQLAIGPAGGGGVDLYSGATGPSNFGTGGTTYASTGSGNQVDIVGNYGVVGVPTGYVSGTALSDTMTFDNATLASLGLTVGQYTYTWTPSTEETDDSFVVNVIGTTPLPATLPLFAGGLGVLGFMGKRRNRKAAVA